MTQHSNDQGIGTRVGQDDVQLRRELEDYICEAYRIDKPTPLMKRQITKFKDEGMSYRGMYLTLYFCFNLAEPPASPRVDAGVAIIPYYYEDARKFFQQKKQIQMQTEALDVATLAKNRVVTIHDENPSIDRRKDVFIDIESIGGADDD